MRRRPASFVIPAEGYSPKDTFHFFLEEAKISKGEEVKIFLQGGVIKNLNHLLGVIQGLRERFGEPVKISLYTKPKTGGSSWWRTEIQSF